MFFSHDAQQTTLTHPGVLRRVLAHEPELMIVEVGFEAGGIGVAHAHPHLQICYCVSGHVAFTLDGEIFEMRTGDSILVPPDVTHGILAHETSLLLDVFTPQRDDFLA